MRTGGWMLLDAAETLFLTAKTRVFGKEAIVSKDKGKMEIQFEKNPKWVAFKEIIKEIKDELAEKSESQESGYVPSKKVLVLTTDERTAKQLQDLVTIGDETLMARMFNKLYSERYGSLPVPPEVEEKAKKPFKHKGIFIIDC